MMRKVRIILVLVILLAVVSCTGIRKSLVDLSEEDLKNAETTRVVAKNLLATWQVNSGFIKGALGAKLNEMPAQVVQALQELDALSLKKTDLTDHELGYSVGLRIRMLSAVVQEAIKSYAPEVLKYLPSVFAL